MTYNYTLYESDGLTLVYEFPCVTDDTGTFSDPSSYIEHTSIRGQGSIISDGSDEAFDIQLTFVLSGTDYPDVVAKMNSLLSTIEKNEKYILKIDLDGVGGTKDYNVKRLSSFQFPLNTKKKRVNFQTVVLTLRANTWA